MEHLQPPNGNSDVGIQSCIVPLAYAVVVVVVVVVVFAVMLVDF